MSTVYLYNIYIQCIRRKGGGVAYMHQWVGMNDAIQFLLQLTSGLVIRLTGGTEREREGGRNERREGGRERRREK